MVYSDYGFSNSSPGGGLSLSKVPSIIPLVPIKGASHTQSVQGLCSTPCFYFLKLLVMFHLPSLTTIADLTALGFQYPLLPSSLVPISPYVDLQSLDSPMLTLAHVFPPPVRLLIRPNVTSTQFELTPRTLFFAGTFCFDGEPELPFRQHLSGPLLSLQLLHTVIRCPSRGIGLQYPTLRLEKSGNRVGTGWDFLCSPHQFSPIFIVTISYPFSPFSHGFSYQVFVILRLLSINSLTTRADSRPLSS